MRIARWGWVLAGVALASTLRTAPSARAEPVSEAEVRLSAPSPATRAEAARALGTSYGRGAPLAHVLATVALEDEDATVRAAAAEAVETLAVTATERWRVWLAEARLKPYEHDDYREVADLVMRLGSIVRTFDLAAGITAARQDSRRADLLAAALLALRPAPGGFRADILGLDALLAGLAESEGPLTAAIASDTLVVLACSRLRATGAGAPLQAPRVTVDATSWDALLTPKGTPWFSESALVVLAATGRPGEDVLARWAREGCLEALALTGQGAARVAHLLDLGVGDAAILPWAKRRLGRIEGVLPPLPGRKAQERSTFARACAGLASVDPECVRPALPALAELLAVRAHADVREAALLAISRVPRLPPEVRAALTRVTLERDQRGLAALAHLALFRGTEDAQAIDGLLEVLEGAIDVQGAELTALIPFLLEARRSFRQHAARLAPVRARLEALLSELLPVEAQFAIVEALGRMPAADEETVRSMQGWLADHPRFTDPLLPKPAMSIATRFAEFGTLLAVAIEAQRVFAAALRPLGARAAGARAQLEHLSRDHDAVVRWHARRALAQLDAR